MEQTLLTLKNRQPTAKQIAYAKTVLAGTAPEPLSGLANAYAHRTLALANGPREEEIVLQALRPLMGTRSHPPRSASISNFDAVAARLRSIDDHCGGLLYASRGCL